MSTRTPHKLPQITDFPSEQVNPAVSLLLEICHEQQTEIQALRDEIARLKGTHPKPAIKPSKLESAEQDADKQKGSRRGKHQRRKTQGLEIHEAIIVPPETTPPPGTVQGL